MNLKCLVLIVRTSMCGMLKFVQQSGAHVRDKKTPGVGPSLKKFEGMMKYLSHNQPERNFPLWLLRGKTTFRLKDHSDECASLGPFSKLKIFYTINEMRQLIENNHDIRMTF